MASKNVKVVQDIYESFGRRDEVALVRLVSPEIQVSQSWDLPWGGNYSGHAGLKQFLATLFTHVDSRVNFERYVDAGDHVAAIGFVSGTVRKNGATFNIPIVHLWKIRDGQAVAFNPYIENALMLDALAK